MTDVAASPDDNFPESEESTAPINSDAAELDTLPKQLNALAVKLRDTLRDRPLTAEDFGPDQFNVLVTAAADLDGFIQRETAAVMPVMTREEAERFLKDAARIPNDAARASAIRRLTGEDWQR